MDIQGMIQNAVQDKIVEQIAAKTGLQGETAKKAISAAMPMIMAGFSKSANTQEGKDLIDTAIDTTSVEEIDEAEGSTMLGKLLGENTSQVTESIASKAGVSSEQASSITSMLTSSVMGKLSAEKQAGSDVTADLEKDSVAQSFLTKLLDKDGDGDIKDDLMDKGVDFLKNKFM